MANLFTPAAPANGPWFIDREDCIGDSLSYINANTNYFGVQIAQVASNTNVVNQITPTALFTPVNFLTRSNQNVTAASWTANGTTATTPWWSGVQTANLATAPTNAVAALVEIHFNVNSYQNNGQDLLVRKDSTENWNSPSDQGGPASGNITTIQRNNIDFNYRKIILDPTGGNTTAFEAETSLTTIVYFNTTSKTFEWFVTDGKQGGAPSSLPYYEVRIRVLGYYSPVI